MTFKALTLAAVAAVGALAAAAPAMAQDWRGGGYGYGGPVFPGGQGGYRPQPVSYGDGGSIRDRADRMQVWIDRTRDSGRLPGWRAWHAQGELSAIRRDARNLWQRQGGIGPGQSAWLNGRLDHLADYVRGSGEDGGYGGYGGWNR